MLMDQLQVPVNKNECTRTNFIQNGYFYILMYNTFKKQPNTEGFDKTPVIYCVAPDELNLNNFWGINFHYFDKETQIYIFDRFVKYYNYLESNDTRRVLSPNELNAIYTNIGIGLRRYNKKAILDSYKIKNEFIPKYLGLPAKWKITNKNKEESKFNLAPGNKGF